MKLVKLLLEVVNTFSGPTGTRTRRYVIQYDFDQSWDDEIAVVNFRMLKVSENPLEILKQHILNSFNRLPSVHLLEPDGYVVPDDDINRYFWITPSDIPQKDFYKAYTLYQKDSKDPECASILGEWLNENFGYNLLTYNRPELWDTHGLFDTNTNDEID
jgi:hypothetical protein